MVKYNATGNERKKLVKKLEALTGERARYQGMPTAAYVVGPYTVDRNGAVSPDPEEEIRSGLERAGFHGEDEEAAAPAPVEEGAPGITIRIPMSTLTEAAVQNFQNMVASKGGMIKMAFGISELPVEYGEEDVEVRWFEKGEPEDKDAAEELVKAMFAHARNAKRVRPAPVESDNPKYNFRVFLNAIGMKGDQYKAYRRSLLKNLPGSAAYRHPVERSGA